MNPLTKIRGLIQQRKERAYECKKYKALYTAFISLKNSYTALRAIHILRKYKYSIRDELCAAMAVVDSNNNSSSDDSSSDDNSDDSSHSSDDNSSNNDDTKFDVVMFAFTYASNDDTKFTVAMSALSYASNIMMHAINTETPKLCRAMLDAGFDPSYQLWQKWVLDRAIPDNHCGESVEHDYYDRITYETNRAGTKLIIYNYDHGGGDWRKYNITILQMLLDYGADINAQYYGENTLLHMAVMDKLITRTTPLFVIIPLLVDMGANLSIKNADGNTPYDLIYSCEHWPNKYKYSLCRLQDPRRIRRIRNILKPRNLYIKSADKR